MKATIAIFALFLASQAAADCSDIDWQPASSGGPAATGEQLAETGRDAVDEAERRRAYLDCMRPAPFDQERIRIEMDTIADDFNRERERFPMRENTLAVN